MCVHCQMSLQMHPLMAIRFPISQFPPRTLRPSLTRSTSHLLSRQKGFGIHLLHLVLRFQEK
ncbi:hypothetical protein HanXRQr2_Chr06g0240201 [Helianthus annuus]|uniref:Uncharacterized protein n=1 Tax=Helianthus annuus TaxID=4232 RepID=A0A9K3IPM6_HELAN|nr:hypothetical protein HanXRQr2_Chr06g0240201 [Helianthus annuus]KAJ0913833.1 hypothetical protein HanPSC8_Chr06g0231791 [Helianthus annuus]